MTLHSLERSSNGRSQLATETHTIRIATAFSETPFGRYLEDGDESGQAFRERLLIPALEKYGHVRLVLDGVEGLPSSFWDEVMGGLIRHGWTLENVRSHLDLVTSDPSLSVYVRLGWRYAQEAADKLSN